VNEHIRNSLPPNFPSQLAEAAFQAGDEWGWPPAIAANAVEWLASRHYAVLGTELWLVRDGAIHSLPIGNSGMPEVHGNEVSRQPEEPWQDFVARARKQTISYLRSFKTTDIIERGDLYFNVVWVDEEEFQTLIR